MEVIYPVGTDISIQEKVRWAHLLYDRFGHSLLADPEVVGLLRRYRAAVARTWGLMEETGVVEECTRCAVEDGGSCCGAGIEDRFDVVLLLINLLAGGSLPHRAQDPTGCLFLGEKGCTIPARHTICVNYICRRLEARLGREALQRLQEGIGRECDAAFLLEEGIKAWLRRRRS